MSGLTLDVAPNLNDVLSMVSQLFHNFWFIIAFAIAVAVLPALPYFFRELIGDYKVDRDYYKERGMNFFHHTKGHSVNYAKDALYYRFTGRRRPMKPTSDWWKKNPMW